MPCERPVIAPISEECCFSCYTEGRGPYQVPIAIVLHEVDEHIEALNNRLENCCHDNPDCHSSFHYGVGHDGRIINWVDPLNTAWSFDPDPSDVNCGVCGWSIATQQGVGVDANLYTINIAVTTGILAYDQSSPNLLAENNYTENQYNALTRLVGWLAETYGIIVNQNSIWRHCDELDDFPEGCACPPNRFDEFLTDVQECIDGEGMFLPWLCDALCDAEVMPGVPTFIIGTDPNCGTCGRYQLGPVMETNFCDIMANVVTTSGAPATPGLPLVTPDCEALLMPTLCQLMVSSNIITGQPIVDDSILVLGNDCQFHVVDPLGSFDLCVELAAVFDTDGGVAVPGVTNLYGENCTYFQLPEPQDLCELLFAATGQYNPEMNWVMLQRDNTGDACSALVVPNNCGQFSYIDSALGLNATTPMIGKLRPSLPNRAVATSVVLDPSIDGVLYVDASTGGLTVTLTPPTDCEPNIFYIKRTDTVEENTVTINAGGSTIDGMVNIPLGTPNQHSLNSGESIRLYWNGTVWSIL